MNLIATLAPPPASDVAKARLQSIVTIVLYLGIVACVAGSVLRPGVVVFTASFFVLAFNILMLFGLRRGQLVTARIVTPLTVWLFFTFVAFDGLGIHSIAIQLLFLPIALAAVFGGRHLMIIQIMLCVVTTLLVYAIGPDSIDDHSHFSELVFIWLTYAIIGSMLWLLIDHAEEDRGAAEAEARALQQVNQALVEERDARSEAESQYKLLADNATDLVFTCDLELLITYISPTSRGMLGYEPEELVGHPATNFIVPEDVESLASLFDDQLALERAGTRAEGQTVTFHIVQRTGELLPVEARLGFLYANDTAIGIIGTVRDISERRSLEASQRVVSQQLRQAQKMDSIGQLASGVAHDFNNLLMAIQGYSELLRQRENDPEVIVFIEEIQKATERAAGLARQLLSFSRQEAEDKTVLNMAGLITDLNQMLRPLIPENIELRCASQEDTLSIMGDKGQLEQLIVNLCINARDAIEDAGSINVQVEPRTIAPHHARGENDPPPGDYIALIVRDTGTGMSEEIANRIFEPFFSTKEHGHGTGLGLTIVNGIAADHEAAISVESEEGLGTTITVLFPRTISAGLPGDDATPAATADGEGQLVLVVEDEDQVRNLVALILKRAGYEVIEAINGYEGLEIWRAQRDDIAIVLSDIVMPEMGGEEMMKAIRREDSHSAFVFMSGYSENPGFVHAANAGFVQKPFSAAQLVSTIQDRISNRRVAGT